MSSARQCGVLVFAKPARPGRVKTRLQGELSPQQAADLQAAFLDDLLERLGAGEFSLWIAWAVEPTESLPESAFRGVPQEGDDLGERLFRGLSRMARHHRRVAAVGSDHPDLPLSLVELAFDKLAAGAEIVVGPAEDGGFYLMALDRVALRRELFRDIEWSTPAALAGLLRRCDGLGLSVQRLPEFADVDTPRDLSRLVERLERRPEIACPRTRRLLSDWSWLAPPAEGKVDENP